MKVVRILGLLFVGLALAGLAAGPVAERAITLEASSAAVAKAEMPDDCPEQMPQSDCAETCPLMALCHAYASQVAAPMTPVSLRFPPSVLRNDAEPDRLIQAPPPKPPKA